ncbi:MAG TPA: 30S ribosome-binding factor RbfA [Candidatus Limnocylindrales bacterium]|nr:30S ribosome-binding factor RbfA [Candidatus Limnocylindrales bacterium]
MGIKQDRIAWRIRQILSELLLREISDPRLQSITVTEVEIDRELQYARVYVNALGDEVRQDEVMKGLEHAKGFLRRELGQSLQLRKTPELAFAWDVRFEHGEHINQVLSSLDIPPEPEAEADDDELE